MIEALRNRSIATTLLAPCIRQEGQSCNARKNCFRIPDTWGRSDLAWLGIILSAALSSSLLIAPMLGPVVIALVVGLRGVRRVRAVRSRGVLLERDLPALLNSVASSVRAGIDPLRALTDAGEYLPAGSPLVAELASFKKALSSGVDEVEALESLFRGEDHPDLELFTRCLILSRRHGSALSEPLHRITRVVRQRQSFRRKTRAALAMHRMSALGIAVCAIFIGGLQFVTNAAGVRIAIESRVGAWLVAGGVTLVAIGVMWMLMMGREERL